MDGWLEEKGDKNRQGRQAGTGGGEKKRHSSLSLQLFLFLIPDIMMDGDDRRWTSELFCGRRRKARSCQTWHYLFILLTIQTLKHFFSSTLFLLQTLVLDVSLFSDIILLSTNILWRRRAWISARCFAAFLRHSSWLANRISLNILLIMWLIKHFFVQPCRA